MTVSELLRLAVEKGASDLHLCAESPPAVRVHGRLERLPGPALTPSGCRDLLYALLGPEQQSRFERNGEIDFAYYAEGMGRFRVNGYLQRGTVALAVRVIPSHVPSLEELGLPPVVADLASRTGLHVVLDESQILVRPETRHAAEMLGLDPLDVANEGKVVVVVEKQSAGLAMEVLREYIHGVDSRLVGWIEDTPDGVCELRTTIGGRRVLQKPYGEQLPRIC